MTQVDVPGCKANYKQPFSLNLMAPIPNLKEEQQKDSAKVSSACSDSICRGKQGRLWFNMCALIDCLMRLGCRSSSGA